MRAAMIALSLILFTLIGTAQSQSSSQPDATGRPQSSTPRSRNTQPAIPPRRGASIPSAQGQPGAAEKQPPFLVDSAVSPDQPELVLLMDATGVASFGLVRVGASPDRTFTLGVSNLVDAQGQPSAAVLAVPGRPDSAVQQDLTVRSGVLPVQLRITPAKPASRLSGKLLLRTTDMSLTWRVYVQPPPARPAVLGVDMQLQPLRLTRCWNGSIDPREGEFSVRVFDKNRTFALQGVFVRVEQVAKASDGFDLARNMTLTFNGKTVEDLRSLGDVPAGTQGVVRGTLQNLGPGEYNVTLRFGAANSTDDDAQKTVLAVFVKDGWVWPLLVLMGAVLLSYLTTKFIAVRRERLKLNRHIANLDRSWLRNQPPSSAVVWAQANLHLAQTAANASRVKIPDMVVETITQVEELLRSLRAIQDLRQAIALIAPHRLVIRRAGFQLSRVSAQCADPPISAEIGSKIVEDLKRLQSWAKPDELAKAYWNDLRASIELLLAGVNIGAIDDPNAQQVIGGLVQELRSRLGNPQDPSLADAVEIEKRYDALELLWENRRNTKLVDKLVEKQKTGANINAMYEIVDSDAWTRLKSSTLRIVEPLAEPQAFEPFTVKVTTDDRELDSLYLFNEGLEFDWSIGLTQRFFSWGPLKDLVRHRRPLTPKSVQPSVTQYSRWKGEAVVSVTLRKRSDCWPGKQDLPKPSLTVPVHKSTAFRLARHFDLIEMIPLGLGFVVAFVTGISTFYAANATFGSLGDYLALFLWGAAVDQVKNATVKEPSTAKAGGQPAQNPATPPTSTTTP